MLSNNIALMSLRKPLTSVISSKSEKSIALIIKDSSLRSE